MPCARAAPRGPGAARSTHVITAPSMSGRFARRQRPTGTSSARPRRPRRITTWLAPPWPSSPRPRTGQLGRHACPRRATSSRIRPKFPGAWARMACEEEDHGSTSASATVRVTDRARLPAEGHSPYLVSEVRGGRAAASSAAPAGDSLRRRARCALIGVNVYGSRELPGHSGAVLGSSRSTLWTSRRVGTSPRGTSSATCPAVRAGRRAIASRIATSTRRAEMRPSVRSAQKTAP
jgi:hypothetical protein